jgi:sec-independent protein translocase protein TatC
VTFEMPVLAFFFARVGLLTHHTLMGAFRYAAVGVFVLAAVLTPPDAISQMLLAGPLLLLYVVSIGVAYVFGKKEEPSEEADVGSTDE